VDRPLPGLSCQISYPYAPSSSCNQRDTRLKLKIDDRRAPAVGQVFCQPHLRVLITSLRCLIGLQARLPCASGGFRKPADITEAELPPEFDATDRTGWLEVIGLGTTAKRKAAQYQGQQEVVIRAGIPGEFAERFQELSEEQKRAVLELGFRELETSAPQQPEFPARDAPDPERWWTKSAEAAEGANEKRRGVRERTVRIGPPGHRDSARMYLADLYTNDDGVMVCQCCRSEMPFKLADGSYYFEAVQFDYGCDRELTQNHMALCPVCAAKYQHARTTPEAEMRAALVNESAEIPVTLAGKIERIKFVNVHKNDLLGAFGILGDKRRGSA
jgi:hypothetical protein